MGVYLYPNNTETPLKNAYIGIPDPTSIVLNKSSISLTTIGQTEQLTATIEPTVSDKTITWSSDDTSVATVSTSGLVTCVTPGECTITATTVNGLTASCSVASGWSPTINTVVYYPLTTTSTTSDLSGNNYTLSNRGATTFGTLGNVECGIFSASATSGLYSNSVVHPTGTNPITVSMWIYPTAYNSDEEDVFFVGTAQLYGKGFVAYNINPIAISAWGGSTSSSTNVPLNTWSLLTITQTGGTYKAYLNGNQALSGNQTTNIQGTILNIGYAYGNGGATYGFIGGISNFIIEDRLRDAQDISDYYDLTKSLYGIS